MYLSITPHYLLGNPKNAQRLMDAIEEYENGGGQEKYLIE
ncbi:MAG: hypothetical protein ACI865_001804 [Flavobacteriaceae bacterium]|jgi:hypothetical protein